VLRPVLRSVGVTSFLTLALLASGPALSAGASSPRPSTPVTRTATVADPARETTARAVPTTRSTVARVRLNGILHAPVRKPVGPSGLAMPKTNLTHWKVRSAQDFTGGSLPTGWGSYEGQPGSEPNGYWKHSHTTVNNGVLTLAGYREGGTFVTGGVMASGAGVGQQIYGKYEVRFRIDKGHGVKYAALLWPESEHWPTDGEIDFAEDGGGNRDRSTGTLHYGSSNSQIQKSLGGDFSRWNTLGVEWMPNKLVYTLNGRPWATVTGSAVPRTAMNLAIQTQAGTCGAWAGATCPDASTPARVNMQIDWAVTYSYVR
jgi:beta-glucanase (GH16 family)